MPNKPGVWLGHAGISLIYFYFLLFLFHIKAIIFSNASGFSVLYLSFCCLVSLILLPNVIKVKYGIVEFSELKYIMFVYKAIFKNY